MTQKLKALTAKQLRAAALLAEDELTDQQIADELQVHLRTIGGWKERDDMKDAIADHVQKVQAGMLRLDIAKRHKRVKVLDDLLKKSLQVMEERADAYRDDPDAHGGATGLIVKSVKQIGGGPNAQVVTEYQVDTGLAKQITSLLDQASGELGQKVEKHEHSGKDGGPIAHTLDLSAFSDEQIDRLAELAEQKLGDT